MSICCEGDLKLYETGNGPDISITNGQPVLDEGLENAVYLSLFSPPGWWGNSIAAEGEKHDSRFEEIFTGNMTNQMRLNAERFAESALSWMISEGVADTITALCTFPGVGRIQVNIEIVQPGKVKPFKYRINWDNMAVRVGVVA